MTNGTPSVRFRQFCHDISSINKLVLELSNGRIVAFEPISLPAPDWSKETHDFERIVSWLYVVYHESGRIAISLLAPLSETDQCSRLAQSKSHVRLVHGLRTFLQHNLVVSSPHDYAIMQLCQGWIQGIVGNCQFSDRNWGLLDQHFEILSVTLLDEAIEVTRTIMQTLERIKSAEDSEHIVNLWIIRVKRDLKEHELAQMVDVVLRKFDLPLDANVLAKKHLSKMREFRKLLNESSDLAAETLREVERVIAENEEYPLVVDGNDLINLGIPEGPLIKTGLNLVRSLHRKHPSLKVEMIERLKATEWFKELNLLA